MRKLWLLLLLCTLVACTVGETPVPTATPVLPTATPLPPTATPTPLPLGARSGWWNDAVFYEVFVRSFYDSDGDGVGDLQGLIEKLDYLNDGDPATDDDLGVTGIWLMPIMDSPSYHGYDIVDYYRVEPDYGTNEDFKALIDAAHERGIRVIIDLVINHTSSAHPWFINSAGGEDAERRAWYVWSDEQQDYRGPWGQQVWYRRGDGWYYAVFWSEMPDLNYEHPAVTAEIYDVAEFWLEEMGADGFRLDAVRYLIEDDLLTATPRLATTEETLGWLEAFREHYVAVESEAMTVGEVWSHTQEVNHYLEEGALDLAFEFDLAEAIISAVGSGSPAALRSHMRQVQQVYADSHYATFLTNHDQERVMERLRGDVDRMKLAAATYLTLPGVPFVYYGEEIGMVGHKPDELLRTPMQWTAEAEAGFTTGRPWQAVNRDYAEVNVASQDEDPDSLLSHYRRLIHLRHAHPALHTGAFMPVESSDGLVYPFLRLEDGDRVLVVLNFSGRPRAEVVLQVEESSLAEGRYRALDALSALEVEIEVGAGGAFEVALPPLEAQQPLIFILKGE
ncbi:MAG: alpha-amylase family glycosyl hydrolase [Anaerolineales bacterium]